MLRSTWVLEHLAVALAVVAAAEGVAWWKSRTGQLEDQATPTPRARRLRLVALAATLVVAARVAQAAWLVTEGSENKPFVAELADFARDRLRLPEQAVLLFEGPDKGEHQLAMFLLDRTCYQLGTRPADEVARQVRAAGGTPYIVTAGPAPWPRRFAAQGDPRALYEWQAPAIASGLVDRLR